MIALEPGTKKPIPVALSLGLLGGAALIITTQLTTKGPAIYIPYTALVIVTIITLRLINWPEFNRRFITAFLSFMVASVLMYIFIGIYDAGTLFKIPVWGHAWRLGLLAVIGGILGAAIAYLADIGRKQTV